MSSRPRRGAGGSKPMGFKVGSCVARNGRLRWTRGGNIEIFFAEGESCFTEQTDPGSNRGDRGIHFPRSEASISCSRARVVGQSVASQRAAAARVADRTRGVAMRSSRRLNSSKGWKPLSQNSGRNETICCRKWWVEAACGWRTNLQMRTECHPFLFRSSTYTIG